MYNSECQEKDDPQTQLMIVMPISTTDFQERRCKKKEKLEAKTGYANKIYIVSCIESKV